MKKLLLAFLFCWLLHPAVLAGERVLTLEEVLLMAREHSVNAAVAADNYRSAYWRYRTFRAELLPELTFSGKIPAYNNSYNMLQNPDGSYSYVRGNMLGLSGEFCVTQNIPFTGGSLSLSSSLDFNWQMSGKGSREFLAVPLSLTFVQPVFGVNVFKWNRKIEPLRLEEAESAYSEEMESVNMEAVTLYFDCILSADNLAVAKENSESAESIYEVARHRRKIGQISETELMQLEISALEARAVLTSYESSYKASVFKLCSFIGIPSTGEITFDVPESPAQMMLDYDDVLSKAMNNSSFVKNLERRRLEAEYAVATAKGELRRIDLSVRIGYSGTEDDFAEAYARMTGQQVVSVGMEVPILDWGKRRGRVRVAESERDVVESQLSKEEMEFGQDIFILVEQFNNQSGLLMIAQRRDKLASSRYASSVNAFMAGKMTALELNNARDAKVSARQNYINSLYFYWYYFYKIRSVTLWDYSRDCAIADRNVLERLE